MLVSELSELIQPPPVGGAVADLRLAWNGRSPRRQLGGALDEDEAREVLGGVVQDAVRGGPVTLGARHPLLEVGVFEVEQGQPLQVRLLGVGLRVIDARDAGDKQVGGGQVACRMVVRRIGVYQVGNPVLGVGMICLVHLDFVLIVICGHDRRESGPSNTFGESAEAGEEVDGQRVVVTEAAPSRGGSVLCGACHDATSVRSCSSLIVRWTPPPGVSASAQRFTADRCATWLSSRHAPASVTPSSTARSSLSRSGLDAL